MVNKKYCKRCHGAGQVDTGIMESPVTICNTCNGTGEAEQPKQEQGEPAPESACCAECGKKDKDGWALYCVECMDKVKTPTAQTEQAPVAVCHDDGYWTPLKTEAGRRFNDLMSKAGRINVYTTPPAQPAPEQHVEDKWRKLALQFDAHRMNALAHLRMMVQDPAKHADVAREFLSAPPPAAQPAVPEGWKLVPIEPTFHQIKVLMKDWHLTEPKHYIERYKAVIAAAPQGSTT